MRLIDADELNKAFDRSEAIEEIYGSDGLPVISEVIDAAPTVDAGPLVRCRDCIYYEPYEDGGSGGSCSNPAFWMPEDGYCSDGEWKEDEEDLR